ncbi:alpha-amylase family glycosyl hydrolase [Halonatronum saccharophilum]|uniref:alpha-amylase family glycosyl hydrolase n=1 Tax=Halonatronum saccharophilum TaxID=150060 RepID=UPI0004B1015E|nr:alpha-amylase family glycosyl hydrolase [Halonatronum saccharophilum]
MRVIMQGFYWNCIKDINNDLSWYQLVSSKLPELKRRGVDTIWLPPPSLGMDGQGMGYDIKEHYNLDSAFGTKKELKRLVQKIKEYDIIPVVDTVMAHMIGGKKEYNPYYQKLGDENSYSYTYFQEKRFPKNFVHFCRKCGQCDKMSSDFGEKICHYADKGYMKDGFIEWGKWLKEEVGFEGFRLDYVKDMKPQFIKEWTNAVGGKFIVGEYWSGDKKELNEWIEKAETKAFNFPLFYALNQICNRPDKLDMRELKDFKMDNTVSFVDNHDTDRDEPVIYDKKIAYAYSLLFTRDTCIFWKDYFNYKLKNEIDTLLSIRKEVNEPFEVKYAEYDFLVGEKDGYQVFINKSKKEQEYQGFKIPPREYIVYKKRSRENPLQGCAN